MCWQTDTHLLIRLRRRPCKTKGLARIAHRSHHHLFVICQHFPGVFQLRSLVYVYVYVYVYGYVYGYMYVYVYVYVYVYAVCAIDIGRAGGVRVFATSRYVGVCARVRACTHRITHALR